MIAISIAKPGGPEVLQPVELPVPQPGPRQVVIRVAAAGVNRPDLMQREGKYPPPPGASDIPGLEVSGTVTACGTGVTRWREGDTVCALVSGGGYAEYCVAPDVQCLPIPSTVDLVSAGGDAGDVLYRLDECLRSRSASRWRIVPRAWGRQRHRHHGHSDGARVRRTGVRDGWHRRQVRGVRAPRRRTRNQLQDRGFFGGVDGVDGRTRVST